MKTLVATDGSASAGVGIQMAAGIAWPADTTVRVVCAVDTGSAVFGGPWPTAALLQVTEIETELKGAAERTVREAAAPLIRPGLHVETAVLEGRPATAIAEEADRFGADLIIVGSRGHGAIATMLLGSVSAEVLDTARVPVLVARDRHLARVLLGWDGSPSAGRAAALLETWPIFADSSIRVVTVSETHLPWWVGTTELSAPELMPVYVEALDAARAERGALARGMVDRLRAAGRPAEAEPREGDAAHELLAAAAAWGAELIVLGTHGRTGLVRLALGSVARNVVHHATCSVLVVRGPAAPVGASGRPAA